MSNGFATFALLVLAALAALALLAGRTVAGAIPGTAGQPTTAGTPRADAGLNEIEDQSGRRESRAEVLSSAVRQAGPTGFVTFTQPETRGTLSVDQPGGLDSVDPGLRG